MLPRALQDLEHLLGWTSCANVEMDAPIDLLGIYHGTAHRERGGGSVGGAGKAVKAAGEQSLPCAGAVRHR